MLKILHTGDLHLGSPFTGLPLRDAEERRAHQLDTFRRMIDRAGEEAVDLFLIAGDLFDSPTVPSAVSDAVFDALEELDCPVVIAPGNHDPYRHGSPYDSDALPGNVFVFRSESLDRFSFPELGNGVDVFGYAFRDATLTPSPLESAPDQSCLGDGLSILLAHGDLDLPLSVYAPIRTADVERCGADYVALGHVHNTGESIRFVGDSAVAYCGFPEGRSFDECGFGGYWLLTFDESPGMAHPLVRSERVRASAHRYALDRVDLSGVDSDPAAAERIRAYLSSVGYGAETALRLTLEGEVALRYTPDAGAILSTLRSALPDAVPSPLLLLDRTLPILDAAYLERDPTIRGAVYRLLKPRLLSGTPEERSTAAEALRVALAALDGRAIL